MATNSSFGAYESKPKKVEIIDIQIGVFFDGTRNNRTNSRIAGKTEEYKNYSYTASKEDIVAYDNKLSSNELSTEESWNNDLSNIARLEKHYKQEKHVFSIYTEGIGTMDAQVDTMEGFAMGAGKYGIKEKVKKASDKIYKILNDLFSDSKETVKIRLCFDVYGFSRGAAAARHFVAMINENVYELLKQIKKINIVKKEVCFLGIYDTVSSYDPTIGLEEVEKLADSYYEKLKDVFSDCKDSFGDSFFNIKDNKLKIVDWEKLSKAIWQKIPNEKEKIDFITKRALELFKETVNKGFNHLKHKGFENDAKELKLFDLQEANSVLHFTAKDEHRRFFALTTVKGCGAKEIREYEFPGVHSDIGGSYIHKSNERKIILNNFIIMLNQYLDGSDPTLNHIEKIKSDKKRLIEEGWASDNDNSLTMGYSTRAAYFIPVRGIPVLILNPFYYLFRNIELIRFSISNRYSYIFLHLMAEEANKKNKSAFKLIKLNEEFKIPNGTEDKNFNVNLESIAGYYRTMFQTSFSSAKLDTKLLKELRRKYFHFSASSDIGYIPRLVIRQSGYMSRERKELRT